MTLITTYVSRRRIYQCGDFRLTWPDGKLRDYWAQKQIFVQRSGWTALIGFCGTAQTGVDYVPEWLVEKLRYIRPNDAFSDLIDSLKSAESWLKRWQPQHRALTFSVAAFVNFKPLFVLVSNFEALDRHMPAPVRSRRPGSPPRFFSSTLHVSSYTPTRGRLFLSGRPQAVLADERWRLIGLIRKDPSTTDVFDALAAVNHNASVRDQMVGSACFTSYVSRLGEVTGAVHQWPADRKYLPAFIDVGGFVLEVVPVAVEFRGGGPGLIVRQRG